jgi:hypothetical protein
MELAVAIAVCFALHLYFQERHKKKIAYVVHVQERTEEAETLDFAVSLFEDETLGKWAEKLERAYSIAEARRGYNNKRMLDEYNRVQAEAKESKKIVPLNKV